MPVPDPPGEISSHDVIEEAGKVSWYGRIAATAENRSFSPYPTPAVTKYRDLFFTLPDVDMNRQVGRKLDSGQIGLPHFYGWDTWDKPVIDFMWMHQFDHDRGIRAAVRLLHGDPWRTLVRFIIREGSPTGPTVTGSNVRFAAEFNPGSQDLNQQYASVDPATYGAVSVQASTGQDWLSVDVFGDYHAGDVDPDPSSFPDPAAATIKPPALLTWVNPDFREDNIDNATPYYLKVELYDGRYNDTLPKPPIGETYDLDGDSTGATAGPTLRADNQDPLYDPGYDYFSSAEGDGGIVLFDGFGDLTVVGTGNEKIGVSPVHFYRYYLQGIHLYLWVYVTQNTDDLGEPYFPDDDNLPAGHPYETQNDDNFTTFELDKWVRFENVPINVVGLSSNTEYTIFVTPFREADIDRYPGGTEPISAPENTQTDEQIVSVTERTDDNSLTAPFIDEVERTSFRFTLDWIDSNGQDGDDYDIQYAEKPGPGDDSIDWTDDPNQNDGDWTVKSEWGTTETDRDGNEFRTELAADVGSTWHVRIRSRSDGALDPSGWSDIEEVTFEL